MSSPIVLKALPSEMRDSFIRFTLSQVVDGNAKTDVSNRREPGSFCGEAEQPGKKSWMIHEVTWHRMLITSHATGQALQNLFYQIPLT